MTENAGMTSLLYRTILNCGSEADVEALFADLCTFQEVEQMAQRITAAKLISEGKTYAEIIEHTGISSATLSRVSRRFGTEAAVMRNFSRRRKIETGIFSPFFSVSLTNAPFAV